MPRISTARVTLRRPTFRPSGVVKLTPVGGGPGGAGGNGGTAAEMQSSSSGSKNVPFGKTRPWFGTGTSRVKTLLALIMSQGR